RVRTMLVPAGRLVPFDLLKGVRNEASVEIINSQGASLRQILPGGLEVVLLQCGVAALQSVKKRGQSEADEKIDRRSPAIFQFSCVPKILARIRGLKVV